MSGFSACVVCELVMRPPFVEFATFLYPFVSYNIGGIVACYAANYKSLQSYIGPNFYIINNHVITRSSQLSSNITT